MLFMESRGIIYLPEEMLEQPFELIKINGENIQGGLRTHKLIQGKRIELTHKRIFDVCFSSAVILLILTWLVPIIALLIKLDSRGPVFFLQKRVGKGGLNFICFKFRTMFVNQDPRKIERGRNDTNITGIGRFLRQSNLDELPQFFNVFLGTMSVVGPRPHIYSDCRRFSYFIANYHDRNLFKPGITGLAQVKGYHGPVSDQVSMFRRYHWDMIYIKKFSILLDLKVVCKTAWQRISWLFLYIF